MLIEFKVANFRSFKEEQTFSLVASKDDKHPGNLIPCEKFNLVKAAALYGPNAGGKSNLIKAMRCMVQLIAGSATSMNQGDRIAGIAPFRLEPRLSGEPSCFEFTVLVNGTRYEYGFSATVERVHREWLAAYPQQGRRSVWLERRLDAGPGEISWAFRGPLRTAARVLKERTRNNGLVLSRGAELNVGALSDLFLWLRENVWLFDLSGRPDDLVIRTALRVSDSMALQDRVGQMVRHADLDIDGVKIQREPVRWRELPTEIRRTFSERGMSEADGQDTFASLAIKTVHCLPGSEAQVEFDLRQDESNGTQRFFALAGPLLDALDKGAVVVVDELDCSMHPLLVRKLIELFQSPEVNKKGAQLIFATHDSTLMDPELFRRDQIWLCEKNRSGATELFSLYDFDSEDRPRSTTAFQRNYLAGRFGGVPKFGPIFEDLELK